MKHYMSNSSSRRSSSRTRHKSRSAVLCIRAAARRFVTTCCFLVSYQSSIVSAFISHNESFPEEVTLRAAVLTNTVPLAYYDDSSNKESVQHESFPEYRGFQPDLLRKLQLIAQSLDNVSLFFVLQEVPPFSYTRQFEYVANNCNTTGNPLSREDCLKYDLIVGDYYGYPSRSIRTLLTPPLLTTAAATLQYTGRQKRQIASLDEARVLQEPVCLLNESHYDDQTIERFPGINVTWCFHHGQCIQKLKHEECALFVEDELQLRYLMVQDGELQVTNEHFDNQYIVWPMNARLDPPLQQLLIRWIYQAKVTGVLDALYSQYFRIEYCPIGKAGINCDQPCSPSQGLADRHGHCICDSTKWTGDDCSIEVLEDKHLIPPALLVVCYIMIGINFMLVGICAAWMWMHRKTDQVKVAQPLFLGLVLVGCLISTSTIFALGAEDEGDGPVWACMAIPWLYSVGFSITFGTLFAKIRRVYLLFEAAAHMRRAKISTKETILIIGAVLAIDVAILTTWTIVDPLEWNRSVLLVDKYGNPLSSEGHCTAEHWLAFVGTIAGLHLLLLAVACYLCYEARNIPTRFSEGKYVTIAMISNLQIFVVGLPILVILGSDSETSFFVRSIIIWMNDFVVVTLIFGNLMYQVHWGGEQSGSGYTRASFIRAAMNSFTTSSRKSTSRKSTSGPVYPPEAHPENGAARFSTFDGVHRHYGLPSRLSAGPEGEDGTEDALPPVLMTVSESEPRLHVDAGNGRTATVPISHINFDASIAEKIESDKR